MAYERLLPDSLTGAWTGAVTDIDEGAENDDGSQITPGSKGDVAVVGFENVSTLVDADTVIDVRLVTKHSKAGGTSGDDSLLFDNMPAPFTGFSWNNDPLQTGEVARCDFTGPNVDIDATAAQINALTVDITANQTGMPSALGHQVDTVELRIEYIKATRVFGDLVQKSDVKGTASSGNITNTFTQANAGNILLAFWSRDFDSEPSVPSGWTKVEYWTGGLYQTFCIYKIADGTETSVTITSANTSQEHTCRVIEIDWNNTAPTIQKSSATYKTFTAGQDTTPALTPSGARNVYIGVVQGNVPGSLANAIMVGETQEEYFCMYDSTSLLPGIANYHEINASGSTSVTVEQNAAGVYGFSLVLVQDKFSLSAEAGSFTSTFEDYKTASTSPTPTSPFVWGETDIWHDHSQLDLFTNHFNCDQILTTDPDFDSFNYYNIKEGGTGNAQRGSLQIQKGDLLVAITSGGNYNGWNDSGIVQGATRIVWKIAEGNELEDDVTTPTTTGLTSTHHMWVFRNPFIPRTGNSWLDLVDTNSTVYTGVTTGTPGSVTPKGTDNNLTVSLLATGESGSQANATIDSSYTTEPNAYGKDGSSFVAAVRLDLSAATNPSWTWNAAVAVDLYALTFAPAEGIVAEAGAFTVTGFDATLTKGTSGGQTIATGLITENETLFAATPVAGAVSITTGFVTENESLFSATPVTSISITTGFVTENESLFAATPVAGAVSIGTGLVTENESLFAATPVAGAVSITTGFVTENESLFAATVVQGQTVTTGFVTENETLFSATPVAGATSITTGFVTENESLFAATPAAATSIATGFVTENESLFAATPVAGAVAITTGLVTENETLFAATPVAGATSISTGFVTENESLFSATVVQGQTITTGFVTENETLFSATPVAGATSITTGFVTENESLFSATVAAAISITTGFVTENESLFASTAVPGTASITTGFVTENEALFAATPVPGATSITTGFVTENETLFSPAVSQGQFITTGLLTENESLFSATAVAGATSITTGFVTENESLFSATPAASIAITTGLVDEQESLFAATAVPGAISISTGFVTENESLFSATPVPGAASISTGFVTENESLFSATVGQGLVITTGLVTENETLFSATPVTGAVSITTGLVTENESLFSPTVAPVISITTGLVIENESLFTATPVPGVVTVTTGFVQENETLFPVTLVAGKKVSCTLVDRNGNALPNLSLLSWAWFDDTDPALFIAPTDQGQVETTDGTGLIEIDLVNTTLTVGQTGTLVLRSDTGTSTGAYNLDVQAA